MLSPPRSAASTGRSARTAQRSPPAITLGSTRWWRSGGADLSGLDGKLGQWGGITGVNPLALEDINKAFNGTDADLRKMLPHVRGMPGISGANTAALDNAKDTDSLRQAIIGTLAQTGMPQTEDTRRRETESKMTDALADLGKPLREVIIKLTDGIAELIKDADPLFKWAAKALGPSAPPDHPVGVQLWPQTPFRSWLGLPPRALHQNITVNSELLSRIGQQESGMGTTSSNTWGELGDTFVEDVKGAARTDKDLAAMIGGMSHDQIKGLNNLWHADIQKKAAQYHLSQAPDWSKKSDMATYAWWNFGARGQDVMNSADGVPLYSVDGLGPHNEHSLVPDTYTVGQWKKARRSLFPDVGTGGAAGGHVTVSAGAPLRIIVQDAGGKVKSEHAVPLVVGQPGVPQPHGTGQ